MSVPDPQQHWDSIYATKAEDQVSWFQSEPAHSVDLIRAAGGTASSAIIDVGGGASRLVDALLGAGYQDLTVLDLATPALDQARTRLGDAAAQVVWIVADVTRWKPPRHYDIWHDRAAFHFLTATADREAYVTTLRRAVRPGGHAIIATFAMDGPEKCSGLPIVRYDPESLATTLGQGFRLVETRRHQHATPFRTLQSFQFSLFKLEV
jgi:SAM-dependent methyltransferase